MRHILRLLKVCIITGLVLIPLSLFAQDNTPPSESQPGSEGVQRMWPVICDDADTMVNVLREANNEKLVFMGQHGPDVFVSLWINEKTRSFSIIIVNKTYNQACMLSMGVGYNVFKYNDSISI